MANIVSITKLHDAERAAIFHVFIQSDGASGDLVDAVLIDPHVDLLPVMKGAPCLTVEQLWYDLSGFNAKLEFDYLTQDTPIWSMSTGGNAPHMDFRHFGGIKDRSGAQDGKGKIKLTTYGMNEVGDVGTVIIKLRKD